MVAVPRCLRTTRVRLLRRAPAPNGIARSRAGCSSPRTHRRALAASCWGCERAAPRGGAWQPAGRSPIVWREAGVGTQAAW